MHTVELQRDPDNGIAFDPHGNLRRRHLLASTALSSGRNLQGLQESATSLNQNGSQLVVHVQEKHFALQRAARWKLGNV